MTFEKQTTININVTADNATININKEVLEQLGLDNDDKIKKQKSNKITYYNAHNIAYIHFDNGAEPTVVDAEYGDLFKNLNFQKHSTGYTTIAFVDNEGKRQQYYLHRFIKGVHKSDDKSVVVDHINNDPSDNRVDSLRVTTNASNNKNRKLEPKDFEIITKTTINGELAIVATDGTYNNVTIIFDDEQEWLDAYKWICEVGTSVAIPRILQAHKDAGNQLEVIADIEKSKSELDELKKNFLETRMANETSGIRFNKEGKAVFITTESQPKYEPFKYK